MKRSAEMGFCVCWYSDNDLYHNSRCTNALCRMKYRTDEGSNERYFLHHSRSGSDTVCVFYYQAYL